MRRLAVAVVLMGLALAVPGCGGGRGPTEPGGRPARGNWIGTISGTHADLGVHGTCDFEMNLEANLSGQWWIDCPGGASSRGQVIGIAFFNSVIFTLVTLNPLSNCPWDGIGNVTAATIEGDFEVLDCTTNTTRSTGTFALRKR